MTKSITGIHHVSLFCCGEEELNKAVAFYRDLLGLPVCRTWGSGDEAGAMLDTGSGIIEIFAKGKEKLPQGAIRHFALYTEQVDEYTEAMRAAGYEVLEGPKDLTIPSEPPLPLRVSFCVGPVGEEIEFFCEKK